MGLFSYEGAMVSWMFIKILTVNPKIAKLIQEQIHASDVYVSDPFCLTDAQAFSRAYFGQGSGPIYLDNVACGTTENRLINCSFDMNTAEDTHAEDAGVRCSGTRKFTKIFGEQ